MEDLDKENNEMVGSDDGLRRRTTTTATTKNDLAADGQGKGKDKVPAKSEDGLDEGLGEGDGGERKEKMETRAISEELRELLVSWKPEH